MEQTWNCPAAWIDRHARTLIKLSIALALIWLFSALAEDVVTRDALALLDYPLEGWLLAHISPTLTLLFSWITLLGNSAVLAVPAAVLLAFWIRAKRRALVWGLALGLAAGSLSGALLKLIFQRLRPDFLGIIVREPDFSFPSGHSVIAMIFYGFLAYALARQLHSRTARLALAACAGLIIFLVGFSRLALGVHYPSDVLAGWTLGALWLFISVLFSRALEREYSAKA